MMKKKIANIVELVLLLVAFILINIPVIIIPYGKVSAFYLMRSDITFWLFCALYLLCAIMCIISIFSKGNNKDGLAHGFVALLLLFVTTGKLFSDTAGDMIDSGDFPGMTVIGLLFLAVVVAFAKRSSLIAGSSDSGKTQQKTVINNIKTDTTNADEIKKYKELLDMGAITQEEFDKKKKELLGL